MPELPEVETIRRQLAPLVEGRRIERIEVLDPRWSRPLPPHALEAALEGRVVERLGRRGKYLLWHLDGDLHLAQHLRMTGSILARPEGEPPHTRVRVLLGRRAREGRVRLAVTDPRRFGTGELLAGTPALQMFLDARLGLEPFDAGFTADYLRTVMRGRVAPIKAMLLDQRRLAGVGNIYADEALFIARIHPLRPAGRLDRARAEALREGVVQALQAGIDARGASIGDFRHIDGVRGSFQDRFLVHLREGEPCVRCGTTVRKIVVAGRGTYVCETCQPRPRGLGRPKRVPPESASRASRATPASSNRPTRATRESPSRSNRVTRATPEPSSRPSRATPESANGPNRASRATPESPNRRNRVTRATPESANRANRATRATPESPNRPAARPGDRPARRRAAR